jgi:hypothetical protein
MAVLANRETDRGGGIPTIPKIEVFFTYSYYLRNTDFTQKLINF